MRSAPTRAYVFTALLNLPLLLAAPLAVLLVAASAC